MSDLRRFYVQRPSGKSLGTLEAVDANEAQSLASAMYGRPAYVFPVSHTSAAEQFWGDMVQSAADDSDPPHD